MIRDLPKTSFWTRPLAKSELALAAFFVATFLVLESLATFKVISDAWIPRVVLGVLGLLCADLILRVGLILLRRWRWRRQNRR
jgi:hypothetical protein